MQLGAAITAQGAEDIASHALGVHTDQGGPLHIAHDHGHVLQACGLLLEQLHGEGAVLGGHAGFSQQFNQRGRDRRDRLGGSLLGGFLGGH